MEMADNDSRKKSEEEKQGGIERRKQEKVEQDNAARYIQARWQWYKDIGRTLGKKKKKKGKKGKKK
jgi:hypothetical protein